MLYVIQTCSVMTGCTEQIKPWAPPFEKGSSIIAPIKEMCERVHLQGESNKVRSPIPNDAVTRF